MIAVPFIQANEALQWKYANIISHIPGVYTSVILGQYSAFYHDLINLRDFYYHEFKPDMIVEYFEGWDKYSISYNDSLMNNIWLCVDKKHYYINRERLFLPQTLDQFITDCQRACIDLVWKESIEEKYFK